MPLNQRALRTAVYRAAGPILAKEVRKYAKLDFDTKKEEFLKEFDEHPVTQELKGGPTAFSNVPELVQAEGNLFSFLGFHEGDNPAGELRDYLDKNIQFKSAGYGQPKISGDKIVFSNTVVFPTVDEVDQAMSRTMPLDWVKKAFTAMITKGAPGLPNYLFRENPRFNSPEPSRSSTAVQTKSKLRGGTFRGVPYVGQLLGVLKRMFASGRARG